ncbi:MFS transporter [Streptomyces sp. BB1-1-1]|uniref:MFS transporter n=1 Tax=Streptomyces sp. BB1-1-1 TaxID=3074430 RepID=UPI002877FFAA|nr:MFS transporter [Streptomyces sp. BB1-1-1]WND39897.1 MFS transporter [Streptomyces sp. BB1-1-1]
MLAVYEHGISRIVTDQKVFGAPASWQVLDPGELIERAVTHLTGLFRRHAPSSGRSCCSPVRSKDPLMPFRLFRNRSLSVGMTVTFIYMATFGTLPYFLTVLMQNVHGYSALETGLAFLVPSVAIATGTQLGERLTTRLGTRTTLIAGFAVGAVGTAVLALGFDADATYTTALPGLILSGIDQGIVWTAMWIAASTGVAPNEQGIANGMASTTLNIGNAIGLAVLTAIADVGTDGKAGDALQTCHRGRGVPRRPAHRGGHADRASDHDRSSSQNHRTHPDRRRGLCPHGAVSS